MFDATKKGSGSCSSFPVEDRPRHGYEIASLSVALARFSPDVLCFIFTLTALKTGWIRGRGWKKRQATALYRSPGRQKVCHQLTVARFVEASSNTGIICLLEA